MSRPPFQGLVPARMSGFEFRFGTKAYYLVAASVPRRTPTRERLVLSVCCSCS